jgi:hypothetical protein
MNIFHVRIAMALAGVVVLVGYLAMGGSLGSKSTIMIEFGMYPKEFQGLDVEIDGEVVGQLEMFGAATRTGFAVKDGKHTVRVLHPEFACDPATITSGTGASQVMLILDFMGQRDGETVIGFQ